MSDRRCGQEDLCIIVEMAPSNATPADRRKQYTRDTDMEVVKPIWLAHAQGKYFIFPRPKLQITF